MVAILSVFSHSVTISIYDITSSVYMHSVDHGAHLNPDLRFIALHTPKIWIKGESLLFAVLQSAGVIIWEVGLAPGAAPVEVETFSIPQNIAGIPQGGTEIILAEFHPPSCRIAFVGPRSPLLVWDFRISKSLLHGTTIGPPCSMTFSSNGHFFACTTNQSEVTLWKESSNGYTTFHKFATRTPYPRPLFSPNGGSMITLGSYTVQLWHTKNPPTTASSTIPQTLQKTNWKFILEFLPDKPLVAVARLKGETVTVLDLKSGVPQLTITTPIEVCGLKSIGNTIVVIGAQKAIAWNLPGGEFPPDARMDVEDSAQTIHLGPEDGPLAVAASMSLDFQYIALARLGSLAIYCTSTGKTLVTPGQAMGLWFAPGGHDLWCCTNDFESKVFTITQDTLHHTKTVAGVEYATWGFPWGSSRGYQVTKEGWVLSREGKRLLMLPPLWRSLIEAERVWNGKFLALLHRTLPEPVILEFEP